MGTDKSDICWVDASIIETFRMKELKKRDESEQADQDK